MSRVKNKQLCWHIRLLWNEEASPKFPNAIPRQQTEVLMPAFGGDDPSLLRKPTCSSSSENLGTPSLHVDSNELAVPLRRSDVGCGARGNGQLLVAAHR